MQIRWVGYRVKGFLSMADRALYWDMICKSATERLNVLRFWEPHGLLATQEAFGLSRRTLFAWRAQLRAGGGKRHTFPRTPKINAHCERFNRTVQEEFLDYQEELLFTDLAAFNERLFEWLGWYNLERPHHALALRTPINVISDFVHQPCSMY